jgi:hypothetical protein
MCLISADTAAVCDDTAMHQEVARNAQIVEEISLAHGRLLALQPSVIYPKLWRSTPLTVVDSTRSPIAKFSKLGRRVAGIPPGGRFGLQMAYSGPRSHAEDGK